MSLITDQTQLKLLNNLANLGTVSGSDLFFIQKSLKSYKLTYTDLVNNLADDATLESSSDKLRVKDNGITTSKILNNNVTLSKLQTIGDNRVLGNVSGVTGNVSQIEIESSVSGSSDRLVSSEGIQNAISTVTTNIPSVKSFGSYTVSSGALTGFNVDTVSKISIGRFMVTMATPAPNTDYTVIIGGEGPYVHAGAGAVDSSFAKTTTQFRVNFRRTDISEIFIDPTKFYFTVFY